MLEAYKTLLIGIVSVLAGMWVEYEFHILARTIFNRRINRN